MMDERRIEREREARELIKESEELVARLKKKEEEEKKQKKEKAAIRRKKWLKRLESATLFTVELVGLAMEFAAQEAGKQQKNMERKYKDYERMEKTMPKPSGIDREKLDAMKSKMDAFKESLGNKTVDEWDKNWISIGRLVNADLSPYNHCVGLYKHVVDGEVMYVGRAIELNNGGFRKRLSDYRRPSDSARKHTSGKTIHENLDRINTYVLVVGDTEEAVEVTKKLEYMFISRYGLPEWNKQIFSRK